MSTKGLERLTRGGYRERIEGWVCDYSPGSMPGLPWSYVVRSPHAHLYPLASGDCRTLTEAQAAAHAVVMERETIGREA